jgi:outer membrane protein assembly factor BamB
MKTVRILVLILCAGFVFVAWGQQPPCKHPSPWAEFHRHDMVRSNPCEKVLGVNNVGSLGLKWSYTTESGVPSSPAVVNGVVYVGSIDNNVYALNARTGAKLWSYTTAMEVYSSPAVANGVVYVGSADNNVYALNARTGAKLWSYRAGGPVLYLLARGGEWGGLCRLVGRLVRAER